MGRNTRWSSDPDAKFSSLSPPADDATPQDIMKQQFSRRLWALMVEKGWNQSELARAAGLGRDIVSVYINAKSLPEPKNLKKLADAFNMPMAQLYPQGAQVGASQETPAIEFRQAMGGQSKGWLRVNVEISAVKALRIMQIVHEPDADA
jgi:transcriptional regulator with XRE-family HTH domain